MEKVNIGIIGCGSISELHANGYLKHPKANLVAICDSSEQALQEKSQQWGIKKTYQNYEDMLLDPEVDAVDIITPHYLHAKMTINSLEAGKHVSVQKPMAITLNDCRNMKEVSMKSTGSFRVFENFKFYPPLQMAKKMLDNGEIGDPISIRMKAVQGSLKYGWKVDQGTLEWRYKDELSGGGRVVFDYGYHLFAVALDFLGSVENIFASIKEVSNEKGWVRDSPAQIIWNYRNSDMQGSWEAVSSDEMVVKSDYWPEDEWFELTGSKGFIWVNRCTGKLLEKPPITMLRGGKLKEIGLDEIDWDWGSSFKLGMFDYVDSIIEGRQSPLSASEAIEVFKLARAAQLSSKKKMLIDLEDPNFLSAI